MLSTTVGPSTPIEDHIIELSLCDAYSPKLWVTQTHLWTTTEAQTFEKALAALTEGLSRTLSEVPALGGKIGRTSSDSRDVVITVEDPHIDLRHEDLTSNVNVPGFEELQQAGFPVTDLALLLSDPLALKPVAAGSPVLVAKLNKLRGGLALTFSFNHLLADATSIAIVERIWAAHTADASAGVLQNAYRPVSDDRAARGRLSKAPPEAKTPFEDPYWSSFPTEQSQLNLSDELLEKDEAIVFQKAKEAHWAASKTEIDAPKWCMWHFSPQALVQLKKDCSAALEPGKWISTLDAIVGLFWSRLIQLKCTGRGDLHQTKLCFPVNLRARLEPTLPSGYIGNAVDIVGCEASIDSLEDAANGWANAALTVRQAVMSWKQSKWESWLATAQDLPPDQALCCNPLMLLDHRNMAFNDYSRSDSNILDWGKNLGRIASTRYMRPAASMKGCATGVVIYPRLAGGGLEIATTTTDDLCRSLQDDAVFSRYATLACAFA